MNWISMKDAKPKEGQICVFYQNDDFENYGCGIAKYTSDNRFYVKDMPGNCGCSGLYYNEITHWIPLEPPVDS